MAFKPKKIVFFHPDLGIGGAERLVVDAAVGLQNLGHKVTIFTSHCDPKHCFDEARDGTLDVRVRGDSLFPPSILGRFSILCAILRQIHLILAIAFSELRELKPDVFFVDQLSAGIPLLRIVAGETRILFYCHFPDKLLAKKEGLIKALYRIPFDWVESWSTGCSDVIVVNSGFTRSVFAQAFTGLSDRKPAVVYPCVDTNEDGESTAWDTAQRHAHMWKDKITFLSINRFERKKDVGLAIRAYAGLSPKERENTRLVIAGGYDSRVQENLACYNELCQLAESFKLKIATVKTVITALSVPDEIDVLFLLSIPDMLKMTLLASASLLVYTPRHEHFGIVPLEAMLAGTPVLAANEGGPTETVQEDVTGWLRNVAAVEEWTDVMRKVLPGGIGHDKLVQMGTAGRERVKSEFSRTKMAERFDKEIRDIESMPRPVVATPFGIGAVVALVFSLVLANAWIASKYLA
ncbi:mannosyltransferase [Phyllosticta citrichinensis]|uniref:Alpha-1,3/1,6-mannosyltransferase ALG2 n=1 Tax=Phyllosticta citrichinensis TaxID=1130410 RepID=A0ABR1XNX5_9PEZI